ncbi:MAG: winged helix-turn-helix domain-containing protein [Actinomycetota bacterium]
MEQEDAGALGSALEDAEAIQVGDLRLYPEEFVATWRGERLFLTPKEFQLLVLFARNPGRLLRRQLISETVWDDAARGRTIDIHVARLRSHLPRGAIETVIRLGYRFQLR